MKEQIRYTLAREGGRVKSAGVPVDFVFEQGNVFQSNPGPDTAASVTRTFHTLRENPPTPIRDRFFPLNRGEVKAMTKRSPALFRPVLKTDQGAGKFLPFTVGKESGINPQFRVNLEQGYVIVETHFEDQLKNAGSPQKVVEELTVLKRHFTNGNLPEARLAYERLQIESEQAGLIFRREASVGRNAVMFIHPAQAECPIILPEHVSQKVEREVNNAFEELLEIAEKKKKEFAKEYSLPIRETDEQELPHYFQADVQILADGSAVVAELQIPDVGLFLAGLPPEENEAFAQVRKIVEPLKEKVIDGFVRTIEEVKVKKGETPIFLVTRPEVIDKKEDVLEIKELEEVQKALLARGYRAEIISACTATEIDSGLLFLFNLDPNSESFRRLATAYLLDFQRRLVMVTDPFLRLAATEVTGYKKVQLNEKCIANLSALVREIELSDKPERTYTQVMAVDYFLRQLGVEDDVLHFCHPTLPTPIPAYRYDVRGLHITSNILTEHNLSEVELRSIPIDPNRGILRDIDGGTLYATFRFMFLRE